MSDGSHVRVSCRIALSTASEAACVACVRQSIAGVSVDGVTLGVFGDSPASAGAMAIDGCTTACLGAIQGCGSVAAGTGASSIKNNVGSRCVDARVIARPLSRISSASRNNPCRVSTATTTSPCLPCSFHSMRRPSARDPRDWDCEKRLLLRLRRGAGCFCYTECSGDQSAACSTAGASRGVQRLLLLLLLLLRGASCTGRKARGSQCPTHPLRTAQ